MGVGDSAGEAGEGVTHGASSVVWGAIRFHAHGEGLIAGRAEVVEFTEGVVLAEVGPTIPAKHVEAACADESLLGVGHLSSGRSRDMIRLHV